MNSRRWIIVVSSLIVILFVSYQILWRVFSLEDRLKELIITEFQSNFTGEISIESVSASFQSFNFYNVSLKLEDGQKEVKIHNLALGFSIFNFLKYNLNPIRFISDVIVDEPVLILQNSENPVEEIPKTLSFNIDSLETQYESRVIDLGFVGRFVIKNGSIIIKQTDNSEIGLLSKLQGWVSTADLERSSVRMQGCLFGSKNHNIELAGQGNLNTGRIDSILISFKDEKLSTTIPSILPEKLKIEKGELLGGAILRHSDTGELVLNGFFSIKNAQLNFFKGKLKLQNLNTDAFIKNWDLDIQSCNLDYDGSPVTVLGGITNLLNPQLNLSIESQNLDLKLISDKIFENKDINIDGKIDAIIQIKNFIKNPVISGNISIPSFSYEKQKFRKIKSDLTFANNVLHFKSITGLFRDLRFNNSGKIDFLSDTVDYEFRVQLNGDLKPSIANYLNSELQKLPIEISGNISNDGNEINGFADLSIIGQLSSNDSIPLYGKLKLKNQRLDISLNKNYSPFNLIVNLNFENSQVQIEGELNRFGDELWNLSPLPLKDKFKDKIDISIIYTGDERYATYSLTTHRKEFTGDSDNLFKIDGIVNTNGKTNVEGNITYFSDTGEQINGDLKLKISQESFVLERYRLGDFYNASGRINFKNTREISGNFNINNADLVYIFDGIFLQPNFNMVGKVSGDFLFGGTLNEPKIQGDLNLTDGIIRAAGYYSGNMNFDILDNSLKIHKADLSLEDKKLLGINGSIDFEQQLFDLNLKGQDVDVPTILSLFVSNIDFLSGKADLDLKLSDRIQNPDLNGTITAKDGMLFFVNYDTLKLNIGKNRYFFNNNIVQSEEGNDLLSDENDPSGLYIQNAHLVRNNRFTINGTGFLPFSSNIELDIDLTGTGDAFSILFEDLPFVQSSQSESQFSWGFGGTYDEVIYTEGKVSVKNGKVQLEDIAKLVENIECEVELEPLNQFLRFDRAVGTIRGHQFSASTRLDSTENNQLEPLVISDWGLNFGVIDIKTNEKGIPLHIPGLMEDDEEGWFIVNSKNPNEEFIISGPSDHPLARGKIQAYNAAFTFPFIIDEEELIEPSLTEEILESMIWDVDLIPLNDVHYVKKLPGLIDNVWINAYIDPQISKLKFSGIIADTSFRAEGLVQSTRGNIEYLDLNFKVEKFAAEFDRSDIFPVVYGKARTTISDSTGFPLNIYLTLYVYDKDNNVEFERARWSDDIRFKLSSDNPTFGSNEAQILAALGYSFDTINSAELLGTSTDHLLFRPLFRPVERRLERTLGLDVIRFHSYFARNMMDVIIPKSNAGSNGLFYYNADPNYDIDYRYFLFRSTQVMVGKFLSNNLYFLYSGQLEAGRNLQYQERGIGIRHSFDLEYRILPNLLLELQYNYDSLLLSNREDKRIQLKHSFVF